MSEVLENIVMDNDPVIAPETQIKFHDLLLIL